MTLDELSNLLETWPKQDHHGEPSELWVMTGTGLSSLAKVVRLNATDLIVVPESDRLPQAEAFEAAVEPEQPPEAPVG